MLLIMNVRRITHILFLLLVASTLLAPLYATVFNLSYEVAIEEKRKLTERPEVRVREVLTGYHQYKFEQYLNDTFGLREFMVQTMANLYIDMLHTSPIERVILGRDNWLFINDGTAIQDTVGISLYSEDELVQFRTLFETRATYVKEKGIPYVYVVVPNKMTVYLDKLPFRVSTLGIETKTDQLIDIIESYTDIHVIDLREVLIEARTRSPLLLYVPSDTHWQPYGAHIAYLHILSELEARYPALFSGVVPLDRTPDPKVADGGDLARMLNRKFSYRDPFILMPTTSGEEPTTRVAITEYPNPSLNALFAYEQENWTLPRAVIVRDSFGEALVPFISELFSRSAYSWTPFLYDYIIEAEKPDIILQFMVERLQHEMLGEPRVSGGF
jgi:hypothetical protein